MVKIENIFLKQTEFHTLNTSLEIEPYINDFRLKLDEYMMLPDETYEILKDYLKTYEQSGILKITELTPKKEVKEEKIEEMVEIGEVKEERPEKKKAKKPN